MRIMRKTERSFKKKRLACSWAARQANKYDWLLLTEPTNHI